MENENSLQAYIEGSLSCPCRPENRSKRRKIFEEGKYSIREVEDNIWALEEKKNGDRKRIKDLREGKNVNGGRVEIEGPTRGPCNLNQSLYVFQK